jgi:protein PhnA
MLTFVPNTHTMDLEEALRIRSGNTCELCDSPAAIGLYEVPPQSRSNEDNTIMVCSKCLAQIEKQEDPDPGHWKKLTETMWSEVPGIQVMAWRMLNRFRQESWAADSLDMLYLDQEKLVWARATGDHDHDGSVDLHRDANGNQLLAGDTVILTKSLDVKGTTLTAKMGTLVKNIRLVPENTEQIEGKIEGQMIVILTKYVRKQGS